MGTCIKLYAEAGVAAATAETGKRPNRINIPQNLGDARPENINVEGEERDKTSGTSKSFGAGIDVAHCDSSDDQGDLDEPKPRPKVSFGLSAYIPPEGPEQIVLEDAVTFDNPLGGNPINTRGVHAITHRANKAFFLNTGATYPILRAENIGSLDLTARLGVGLNAKLFSGRVGIAFNIGNIARLGFFAGLTQSVLKTTQEGPDYIVQVSGPGMIGEGPRTTEISAANHLEAGINLSVSTPFF